MFKVREMTYGKRNSKTKQKFPDTFSVEGFKKEHYAKCTVQCTIEGNDFTLDGVSLQNPITGKWVINAIDGNYNQVVLDVVE